MTAPPTHKIRDVPIVLMRWEAFTALVAEKVSEDQDAFLQARVLDLIWTLREAPSSHRSRF